MTLILRSSVPERLPVVLLIQFLIKNQLKPILLVFQHVEQNQDIKANLEVYYLKLRDIPHLAFARVTISAIQMRAFFTLYYDVGPVLYFLIENVQGLPKQTLQIKLKEYE